MPTDQPDFEGNERQEQPMGVPTNGGPVDSGRADSIPADSRPADGLPPAHADAVPPPPPKSSGSGSGGSGRSKDNGGSGGTDGPDGPKRGGEKEMSFLDHLEELRWHIIRSFASIFVFSIAALLAKRWVFEEFIFGPKHADFPTYRLLCKLSDYLGSKLLCVQPQEFVVQNIDVMGQFMTHLKVSFMLGFILSFPYMLWEIWRFVKPGLYDKEINVTQGLTAFCTLLFALGIGFGYFVIIPFSLNFLVGYSIAESVSNEFNLTSYINFVSMIILAAGVMFQLPIVIYFLAKLGIVDARFLRKHRKHAFILILVASAIITPPDVTSQLLITVPVFGLYEVGIWIAKRVAPKPI